MNWIGMADHESFSPSRREILKLTGAAALSTAFANSASASRAPRSPNERIRWAIVGCAGKGTSNMADAARNGDIVGVCDVDLDIRMKAMTDHPRASSFSDFRRMLEALEKHIDAVVVSTPDHTHAPAAAMAMRMGKAVYCEKPLTRTLWEARELTKIARSTRVATQMGNQGTASNELRWVAAVVKSGALGKVKEVHCWTDRAAGWWPQGVGRPDPKIPPRTLDWDCWVGPSPMRPYAEGYHPFAWRGRWDFGTGSLGDMGCHIINLPFMGLDLRDPIAVQAETSGNNKETFPTWSRVKYEFGQRGNRDALMLYWYDGGQKPPTEISKGEPMGGNGTLIVAEKGTIHLGDAYGGAPKMVGGGEVPKVDFEKSPGHFQELVDAINGGKAPRSNIADYSGPLTETVLLGNLAIWAGGERVVWDSRRLAVVGNNAFDPLIRPTYREGYSL